MKILTSNKLQEHIVRPALYDEEQKIVLGISIMLLLSGHFALNYVGQTFFSREFLNIKSLGFWLIILNAVFIAALLLVNKSAAGWTWSKLGFAKPTAWWKTLVVALGVFISVLLLSRFIAPYFMELSNPVDMSHLFVINQNLPLLILSLFLVWVTAAFLEELVFRAFLINSLDIILGRNEHSTIAAVIISSVIFGLMHAWQGLGGILTTACIGLIFGIAYLLNGRRIWALILVHGIIDSITLVSIYNM